jgi:YD repeat-containing protein
MNAETTKRLPCAALCLICFLLFSSRSAGQVLSPSAANPSRAIFGIKAADPFDVGTGIYYREHVDLVILDTIPIRFVRTQRNLDNRSRSFGVGGNTSYDMFIIGDVDRFSWVALVMADGAQIRYARISSGTGYSDGVFENKATPGEFLGSRITWSWWRASWIVEMKDGSQYTVHGCSADSKPGQCAVIEIKNKAGERLVVQRDGNGNMQQIKSPHGHFVSVTNDSAGRITRIDDDAKHWVTYQYDPAGALVKARTWQGTAQDFTYDAQFNMTRVQESGTDADGPYAFTVNNSFNEQNRFKSQTVSDGYYCSAQYVTDANNNIVQAEVRDPEGLSRYFFNEVGYEIREEFHPVKGEGWTYERVRDPKSNEAVELFVQCRTAKIELPIEFDEPLGSDDNRRSRFLSARCKRAEAKAPDHQKSLSAKPR